MNSLTDAELDAIEAMYPVEAALAKYGEVACPLTNDMRNFAALLAAVREARALVAGLVSDEAVRANGIPGGYIECDDRQRLCTYCYARWLPNEPERHAEDCDVGVARKALDAWKGEAGEND